MKKFYKPVDKRSKKAMIAFLENHFRYNTMNSWNGTTSYANNVKIHHLGLPQEIENQLFDFLDLDTDDISYEINDLLHFWGEMHGHRWQAGFNGRSGGYLVLYQGGIEPTGYKSYCTKCGQLNFTTTEKSKKCGRCGQEARVDFKAPHQRIVTYPGRGTDQGEDFSEWDMFSLRERVALVQDFDDLCDQVINLVVGIAKSCKVVDKEIYVPKTIKVLQTI